MSFIVIVWRDFAPFPVVSVSILATTVEDAENVQPEVT